MYVFSISYSQVQKKSGGCPLVSLGCSKKFRGRLPYSSGYPPVKRGALYDIRSLTQNGQNLRLV